MTAIIVSLILGIIVACIGAWKDTLWEPFRWRSFVRTPILVLIWALMLQFLFQDSSSILVALAAIAMERFTIEGWKAVLRPMPSKFRRKTRDTLWLLVRWRELRHRLGQLRHGAINTMKNRRHLAIPERRPSTIAGSDKTTE